jgi:S-adenosylmethionine-dependent methyltransferase
MDQSTAIVKKYYDNDPRKEWNRLKAHPFEFALTTYMMDSYIHSGDSILDIGGGPGRYSIYYAKRGCDVTLVDLSDSNIKLARKKARYYHVNVKTFACDCLEMGKLGLGAFDHVFLMGPLYHLLDEKARARAVNVALSHLKPNGIFYCSFILDFAGIIYDLKMDGNHLSKDLENSDTKKLLDSIVNRMVYEGPAFTKACFINQKRIDPFMKQFALTKLHLFGQEGILAPNELQIMGSPKKERDLWIETAKLFLELSEYLSYSEHAMYIGKKR